MSHVHTEHRRARPPTAVTEHYRPRPQRQRHEYVLVQRDCLDKRHVQPMSGRIRCRSQWQQWRARSFRCGTRTGVLRCTHLMRACRNSTRVATHTKAPPRGDPSAQKHVMRTQDVKLCVVRYVGMGALSYLEHYRRTWDSSLLLADVSG